MTISFFIEFYVDLDFMSKLHRVNVLYINDFLQQNCANSSKHQQGFIRVNDGGGKGAGYF